jgi:hypothetical protein
MWHFTCVDDQYWSNKEFFSILLKYYNMVETQVAALNTMFELQIDNNKEKEKQEQSQQIPYPLLINLDLVEELLLVSGIVLWFFFFVGFLFIFEFLFFGF